MSQNSQGRFTDMIALGEGVPATLSLPAPAPAMPGKEHNRKRAIAWSAIPLVLIFGVILEGIYLILFPLFIDPVASNDALQRALPGLWPWVPDFYWTRVFPQALDVLKQVAWFDPTRE